MKKILLLTLSLGISLPIAAYSQQVTNFPVCTNYQENYYQGGYDTFGNYVQGEVSTNQYNFNCLTKQPYPSYRPYNGYPVYNGYWGYQRAYPYGPYGSNGLNPYCNPTRTALGATFGGSLGYAIGGRKNSNWAVPLGAALGGLAYSC